MLELSLGADAVRIRQAYRELSKRYHPDTTELPADVAKAKFQTLNEAYATLSNPERRGLYDRQLGYRRWQTRQQDFDTQSSGSSAYLDPTDRPLSTGEVFALFVLGLTFLSCLLLAIGIGLVRGDFLVKPAAIALEALLRFH
ncbi:MAG: J domain-containing protein [Cyanobacteria bacterium J06641_5]